LVDVGLSARLAEGAELLHPWSDAAAQLLPYSLAQAARTACADE